jgi:hypothetical protein
MDEQLKREVQQVESDLRELRNDLSDAKMYVFFASSLVAFVFFIDSASCHSERSDRVHANVAELEASDRAPRTTVDPTGSTP